MKTKKMCLCEGRHVIPEATNGAIFNNTLDPLDLEGMHRIAKDRLHRVDCLHLYVTGLTVALVEVIKVCREKNIELILHHYNTFTGTYYTQTV